MAAAEKVDREVRQHHHRWRSHKMQDIYLYGALGGGPTCSWGCPAAALLRFAQNKKKRVDFNV